MLPENIIKRKKEMKNNSANIGLEIIKRSFNASLSKPRGNYILEMFDYVRLYGYHVDYSYFDLITADFNEIYVKEKSLLLNWSKNKNIELINKEKEAFLFYMLLVYVSIGENKKDLKCLLKGNYEQSYRNIFIQFFIKNNIRFGSQILDYIVNKNLNIKEMRKLKMNKTILNFLNAPASLNLLENFIGKTKIQSSLLTNEYSPLNSNLEFKKISIIKLTIELIVSRDRLNYGENEKTKIVEKIISKINKKTIDFNKKY